MQERYLPCATQIGYFLELSPTESRDRWLSVPQTYVHGVIDKCASVWTYEMTTQKHLIVSGQKNTCFTNHRSYSRHITSLLETEACWNVRKEHDERDISSLLLIYWSLYVQRHSVCSLLNRPKNAWPWIIWVYTAKIADNAAIFTNLQLDIYTPNCFTPIYASQTVNHKWPVRKYEFRTSIPFAFSKHSYQSKNHMVTFDLS